MINNVYGVNVQNVSAVGKTGSADKTTHKTTFAEKDLSSSPTPLSVLSLQLADSAARADAREKSIARQELGLEGRRLAQQLCGDSYYDFKDVHDAETPKTSDIQLLERARQATRFSIIGNHGYPNPFADLTMEQAYLIAYDDQGSYTINERHAAYATAGKLETQWNNTLWGPQRRESEANDGRCPQFLTEVLSHYRSLPLIEQARYPDNYETRLEREIQEDSDPSSVKKLDDYRIPYLFEILARYRILDKEEKPGILDILPDSDLSTPAHVGPAEAITTSSLSPDACPSPAAAERS